MDNKFVILTGIPGIGKTTIAQLLEQQVKPLTRLGFGDLVYEVLQHEGIAVTRTQIRTAPDKYVSISSIQKAAQLLLDRVTELRQTSHVIVETHAVVKDFYGFWIVPEISDFKVAELDAVIVIHTPFELVEQRLIKEPAGRNLMSKHAYETYQSLLDAVAVNFGLTAGCPVFILDTDNDLTKTTSVLRHIFRNIGMLFEEK